VAQVVHPASGAGRLLQPLPPELLQRLGRLPADLQIGLQHPATLPHQGSILQNSISAENLSDKVSSQNFG
jgi:hypothetical protein